MTEEAKPLTVYQKLAKVQAELKAPKNQFNSFGKYNYRSLEDIQEGLKPLLKEVDAICLLSDSIELVGDRYYLKATARFICTESGEEIEVQALARESLNKKGMDDSQITGTASSYARKYAMNGLFAIDDTKDADTDQHTNQVNNSPKQQPAKPKDKPEVIEARKLFAEVKKAGVPQNQLDNLVKLMKESNITEFTIQAYLAYIGALGADTGQITHLAGLQKDIKKFTETAGFMLAELKEKK